MEDFYKNILVGFALVYGAVLILLYVWLYARKRLSVFCGLSAYFGGLLIYVTFSTLTCVSTDLFYENVTGWQVFYFIAGNLLFLAVMLGVYLLVKPKDRYSRNLKYFDREANFSLILTLFFVGVVGAFFFPLLPGLGRLFYTLGSAAILVLFGVAAHRWFFNKLSLLNSVLVVLAGLIAVYSIFEYGFSRKPLLVLAATPLIVFYYSGKRIKSLWQFVLLAAPLGIGALIVLGAWSNIRVSVMVETKGMSVAEVTAARFERFADTVANVNPFEFLVASIGDNSTAVSLAAAQNYIGRDANLDNQPFNAFLFTIGNPIPRIFWDGKPSSLGSIFPEEMGVWQRTGYVNWGTTIVGHSAHEGGLHFVVFYAIIIGYLLRRYDHYVEHNFHDPLCVAIVSASFVQLLGFPRGDFGVFAVDLIAMFIVYYAVRLVRMKTS